MKLLTYGIYLVVLCLPLYLVRFEIFGIPTTVLEVLIYALFVFWLIKKLSQNTKYKIRGTKYKSLFIPIILIVIGASLAIIFSTDLRASAGIWKAWFLDPLLFFVVVITTIKNLKQIKGVLYSLFLSGAVVSVISLIYLIQGKLDPFGRLQAFYDSPNYLAMYLAPALIIGLGFISKKVFQPSLNACSRPNKLAHFGEPSENDPLATLGALVPASLLARFTYLVTSLAKSFRLEYLFVIAIVFALCFTKSFGAWLGIIAAVCFGVVFYLYKSGRKQFALTILYLVLLIIVFLGYFALIQKESSFDARIVIWQEAWEVFKANPILGIGPGTFGNYFPPYPELGVPQPHNIFLAFLLQTGIIGFIGFIWLLIWFFRTGAKLLTVHCSLFTVTLMSVMVYILVHGLVDTTYWKNDLSVIFWIIVALMVVLKNRLDIRHLRIGV